MLASVKKGARMQCICQVDLQPIAADVGCFYIAENGRGDLFAKDAQEMVDWSEGFDTVHDIFSAYGEVLQRGKHDELERVQVSATPRYVG